ncbi:MAG: O-methyltransferase [Acidobacteriia bacterium]|nr:O-methyltransferase [Terriglobia bacterium]
MSEKTASRSSEPIDEALIERIDRYIERLFVPHDPSLEQNIGAATAAGLPEIQVSANQGKLLYLIAKMARASKMLEIGTLGGYSTTWLARAMPGDGKLITLELDPKHAAVARGNLERAGASERVEIRIGRAAETLRQMIGAGEPPFDLIFIDADKPGYVEYLNLSLQLARSGTVILADNVIRHGRVLEENPPDENARGAKAFNDAIAAHPRLESILLPIFRDKVDGLSISIVK